MSAPLFGAAVLVTAQADDHADAGRSSQTRCKLIQKTAAAKMTKNIRADRIFTGLGVRTAALSLAALSVVAFMAKPAAAQSNPYQFKKEAFKPDGTPWSGPVNVGDVIKYVLSYKPGPTNSGPATIDDTLSPNLQYVPPTKASDAGWTWSSSPYSIANHEKYSHPGFGPNTGSVKVSVTGFIVPASDKGDGTKPIPVGNRVFGVFHHALTDANSEPKVDCWILATLAKCGGGYPTLNSTGLPIATPMEPNTVVRNNKIYFVGTLGVGGIPTIGCFDTGANSACADTPLTTVPAGTWGTVGGLVEGQGRVFAVVNKKVFCRQWSGSDWTVNCTGGWNASGTDAVTGPVPSTSYAGNMVSIQIEQSASPGRVYVHVGQGKVQCLEIATGALCPSWPAAGITLGSGSGGSVFSSVPAGAGENGVCLWNWLGQIMGCVSQSAGSLASPGSALQYLDSTFRIPTTGKIYFPRHGDSGLVTGAPTCMNFNGTSGTPCAGFVRQMPVPEAWTYGFALDPLNPQKCMLALGHKNVMWRFDSNTGEIGCTQKAVTPKIEDIYCNGKPTLATFQWTTVRVLTPGASGTLTITKGTSAPITVAVTSGSAFPMGLATGYDQLSFSYAAISGPTTIDLEVDFKSDKNPQICYQAKVIKCGGPVFNDAVMKANFNGAPTSVSQHVDLGKAGGPECPELSACLKDSKVNVTCNGDGTFTVTLSGSGFTGTDITMTSQTPGLTVSPPQQPWAPTTTWKISGATSGQSVTLFANGTNVGGGTEPNTDQCCSGEIKIVMPDCPKPIDVAIGKENTPGQGGGAGFNIWVTNLAAPITFPAGGLTVTDTIPAGMTVTGVTAPNWTCTPVTLVGPGTITCTYNLAGSLATNASLADAIVIHDIVTNHERPLKNCAQITIGSSVGVDSNPSNNEACATTSDKVDKVDVAIKKTGGTSPAPQVNGYAFHLAVTNIGSAFNGTNVITVTDVVPAGMTFNSATGANWSCATLPASAGSTITCTYTGLGPTAANQPLGVIDIVATAKGEMPFPPFTNCAMVGLKPGSGFVDTNPSNNESCVTVRKPEVCPPPMVPGPVAGGCICPQGTVLQGKECVKVTTCSPPLVLLPGGACGCPQGTVLRGRECVKPIECRRPLIPNAAGTECVCREGYVKRGNSCVERLVCREPAKLNRAENACTCPRNMVLKGNTCVERGPQITPNDVIRNIPGGFGPGRGGRDNPGDPHGGGDKSGPTRGGGNPAVGR